MSLTNLNLRLTLYWLSALLSLDPRCPVLPKWLLSFWDFSRVIIQQCGIVKS